MRHTNTHIWREKEILLDTIDISAVGINIGLVCNNCSCSTWCLISLHSNTLSSAVLRISTHCFCTAYYEVPFSNRNSVGAHPALAKPMWNLRLSVISDHLEHDINLRYSWIYKDWRKHHQTYSIVLMSSNIKLATNINQGKITWVCYNIQYCTWQVYPYSCIFQFRTVLNSAECLE